MLIARTGWTWEYIDEHMTIARLAEMTAFWKKNPPVDLMVAAYLGIENKPAPKPDENFGDLLAHIPMA